MSEATSLPNDQQPLPLLHSHSLMELDRTVSNCPGAFRLCVSLEVRLMSLEMVLMTLGVRLERELEDEFGGDFDEFGHGFGKKAWR